MITNHDMLKDKSAEEEFGHVICFNTGFIFSWFNCLRQTYYLSEMANLSKMDIVPNISLTNVYFSDKIDTV